MTSVEVRPIELPRDAMAFCKSWWPIYADDPHWVPPLLLERKAFFDPGKNPYFQYATIQCFMAYRDGQPVGTIAATVDHKLQETEPGVGLFGFYEFVDDEAVSAALFDAARVWLAEQGMHVARGPFNFNTNHEFGLLIDGFDTDPCIANPHNRGYYQRHYEDLGMVKVMDWFAYWLVNDGPVPPRIARIAERFLERNPEVTLRKSDPSRWKEETQQMYEVYEDAWEQNWGHIRFSREEFDFVADGLKQIINPDLVWVAEVDGEVAGISVTLPDFNQVAKKMNGRIFPFGWWHYLTGRSKIDHLRVFILGIKQKYQKMPLGAPLYLRTWEEGRKLGVKGAEASLILETNHRMRGALEKLGGTIYKTYRTYEVPLVDDADPSGDAAEE